MKSPDLYREGVVSVEWNGGSDPSSIDEENARRILKDILSIADILNRNLGNVQSPAASAGLDPIETPPPPQRQITSPVSFTTARARIVRQYLAQRRRRDQHFPGELFADPAWDMLLDLYAAHHERTRISISSLCIAAAVPATTGLRWIKTMEDAGHFVRVQDEYDGRRIFIQLSEDARSRMEAYFDSFM